MSPGALRRTAVRQQRSIMNALTLIASRRVQQVHDGKAGIRDREPAASDPGCESHCAKSAGATDLMGHTSLSQLSEVGGRVPGRGFEARPPRHPVSVGDAHTGGLDPTPEGSERLGSACASTAHVIPTSVGPE